jgi:tRNA dimethylallyltransferase
MNPLVAIVGPTAAGKSRLALHLGQIFAVEIVNADSRQVYRYLDIGTAKPTPEERALVPHHLLDLVDPDEEFNLALYQQLAYQAITDIQQRGKLPLLVGGSGLYIWAVLEGWKVAPVPPDSRLRRRLEEKAAAEGIQALYEELRRVDPPAAARIDPRNVRRVIRALEVFHHTGIPFSRFWRKEPPPWEICIIGLTLSRAELYHRIDSRVDRMMEQGFVEEVRRLMERGYSLALPAMSSLGYREVGKYLQGELSLPEAIQRIKLQTHRFARQQYTWFRLKDERICWFDATEEMIPSVVELLKRNIPSAPQKLPP